MLKLFVKSCEQSLDRAAEGHDEIARQATPPSLLVDIFPEVFLGHLSEPAKHVLAPEFPRTEIAGAAERNGASVAQDFPLSLSGLYRRRGTRADDGFSGGKTTIHEIKRQRHEIPARGRSGR